MYTKFDELLNMNTFNFSKKIKIDESFYPFAMTFTQQCDFQPRILYEDGHCVYVKNIKMILLII